MFGMYWYGDPGDGTSIVACCGGGGSAATGVKNLLTIRHGLQEDIEPMIIKTGSEVGVGVYIAKNPFSNKLSLFCALGSKVNLYSLPDGNLQQELEIGDNVNAVVANAMVDRIAVGCESGTVKVYDIIEDYQVKELASYVCEGHGKAVSAVAFAPRTNWIVSSGKDGTARVWNEDQCISVLTCSIKDPKEPAPKRAQQVLVRGCGFGDLDGKLVFTVASGRKGKAYLSKWGYDENQNQYQCIERTVCSEYPISAMSVSCDATNMALGAVNGTIILWNVEKWRAIRLFPEVHDLPVTCIAARPYEVPLQGEEDSGVKFNALSASADSQMAWLTLQRRGPKSAARKSSAGPPLAEYVNFLVKLALFFWIFSPVAREMMDTCGGDDVHGLASKLQCIRDDVLIAPLSRPGIAVPPH
jgi:WD40 repeat protein